MKERNWGVWQRVMSRSGRGSYLAAQECPSEGVIFELIIHNIKGGRKIIIWGVVL
jgi:hypothetical protein